jgi:hypothetical protein
MTLEAPVLIACRRGTCARAKLTEASAPDYHHDALWEPQQERRGLLWVRVSADYPCARFSGKERDMTRRINVANIK